ncbi:DUF2059 domain-containing protein [Marivita sp. XM-24bin2]|jgi:hypothetical protein|uniref:DUF2059 domain-containing protein n=1 Tax=unclassified Marivita TaxID=2632480 RepID=UPI0025C54E9E|nr:DUF2059 domain-containing protein [Marivita sp. XM-24bin2]MCR9111020.1 DUF2059 domain-containing protein [Paracoccaceae bacterium]
MIGSMARAAATAAALMAWTFPGWANPTNDLLDALGVPQIVDIMRKEGISYGEMLAEDMVPGGGTAGWDETVKRIYDEDRMLATVQDVFATEFGDADTEPLLAFFSSETGQQIVSLELSARNAMRDEEIEDAARAAFRDLEGTNSQPLAVIEEFVETNDLVEANLVGALNANYMFYLGLVDGGALRMSESDILTEVWSSEEETRQDTREWVFSFLLMAYRPLEDGVVEDYTELSRTEPGRALNRALFAGFNKMYDDISYALGMAVAREMQVQEL